MNLTYKDLYVKVADTEQTLTDAYLVRDAVYSEELGWEEGGADWWDIFSKYAVVYMPGDVPIATLRVVLPEMPSINATCAEVSRFCILQKYRGSGTMMALLKGLYLLTPEHVDTWYCSMEPRLMSAIGRLSGEWSEVPKNQWVKVPEGRTLYYKFCAIGWHTLSKRDPDLWTWITK